jgi:5-methylcytosine-specific restriction endonuclease McrA
MSWDTSNRRSRLPANWRTIRRQVLARDRVCQLCGIRAATVVDHIEAMTDDHRLEALQGVCDPCHRQKSAAEGVAARAAARGPGRRRPEESHPGLI